MSTTLVSAVIPCYNYGRFVARAIDSVLAQTHQPTECIAVDDGSTDDTLSVLRRYERQIVAIHQSHRGVSAARNAGIAAAHGQFIAFLDGDDWWHPQKIERQLALFDGRPALGCVGCGLEHVYPDGRVEHIAGKRNESDRTATHRRLALRRFWIYGSGSGAMVRRRVLERIGAFDQYLEAAEDWDLWLRIAAEAEVDNVPAVLASINRHGTGMFRNAALMERNQWRVYRKIIHRWPDLLTFGDRRRLKALILADAARESTRARDAAAYYLRSLGEWPFSYSRLRSMAAVTVRSLQSAAASGRISDAA